MKVLFVSHACLRYEIDDIVLLTDPWLTDDPIYCDSIYKFPHTNSKAAKAYQGANWLYISHTHEDHFHIPSLKLFSKDINIIVPNFNDHNQGRRANLLKETLICLGFKNLHVLNSWQVLSISPRLSFQLIPSAKSRKFDWENSGLLIKYMNKTILNMNDNVADQDLCMDILKYHKKIDIYLIQSSSVTSYPACFKYSDEEKLNIIKKRKVNYKYHDVVMENLKPEFLIPYAGDLGWFGTQKAFNYLARNTPLDLINYIKSKGFKSLQLDSGDSFELVLNNFIFNIQNLINWTAYENLILDNENYYRDLINEKEKKLVSKNYVDFELNLQRYIDSINDLNKSSDAFIESNSSICYQIDRNSKSSIYVIVTCKENRYLFLEKVNKLPNNVSQIHITSESLWINILKGNYMLSQIAWRSVIEQKYINSDVINLIFAIGYHIDGDNRSKELKLRPYYQIK